MSNGGALVGSTSQSHSTGADDFRQSIFNLATATLQAHTDDIQDNHNWLDSFLESVRISAQPRQREQTRNDMVEIMKTPGRRRVGLTPSHNNTSRASPTKLAAKDPVATLLFGNPRRPSPGPSSLSNGKENAGTPPTASPSTARRPFGAAANTKSVFSPIRGGLPSPSARTTAPTTFAKPPSPVKDAYVLSPPRLAPPPAVSPVDQHAAVEPPPVVVVEPEPEPEEEEEEEEDDDESDSGSVQELVGDLSNVMEEDEEEQAPVDHDSDTDDDLAVQEELVGQASFEAGDEEKANLSIIGEEEEEDDVFAAKPSTRQAPSPAALAHSSSLVVEETQASTVPETQFSPVRPTRSTARLVASPVLVPIAVAVRSPVPAAPEQAVDPPLVSQDPPTPRHSTSSIATVIDEADADTAVPLNDGPSSLRNALPSAPSSASSTRTPSRFGAGTYSSSAKAGLGINIGSSPPFAHHPITVTATTTTPGFGLGRPSTGGTVRAPLNFVGLPKKSLPFALGRGLGGHQSWSSSVADSQGSSQGSSQPSQPSTQATSVATALSTANSFVTAPVAAAGIKRKSLNAPDVPNKAAKLAADSVAEDNTEGSKTRRDLLNRMQAMSSSRVSGVARPSAIGFSMATMAPVVAPKSLGPAASAPALHTSTLPTPAPTPVEPTFAASKLPAAIASHAPLHGSVVPAGPAPIPPINTNFLSPAKPSASSRNVPTRASPAGQSLLPTLTRRTSVKDVVKSFERNTVADAAPPSPSKPPPANSQLFRSPSSSYFSPTSPGRRPGPSAIACPTSPLPPLSPRPARIPTAPTLPNSPPEAVHRMTLRSPSPAKVPPTPPARQAFSIVIPVSGSASKGKKLISMAPVVPPTPPSREPEVKESTTPPFSPPREPLVLGRGAVPPRARQPEPETEIEDDEEEEEEEDDEDMYGQEEDEEPVVTLREVVPVPARRASSPFSSSDESDDDSDDDSALYPLPAHPDAGEDDGDDSYGSDGDDEDSIVIVEPGRGALASAFDGTRMEVDTFTYTSVKATQPFKPAPPPGAVRTNVIRASPGKVVMPGSFDGEDGDSDDDVAGGLLLTKSTAAAAGSSSNANGRTLHKQSSVASLGGQSSSQGGGSQRSASQQSQNAPGAFSFLNRGPFGGGPGTAPMKGEAPKAVKSIQLAAAAAKKEKEERERKAALKEETQRKRLALVQKKQDDIRTKAEEERRARVDGAEKKRKERDDAAQKAKVNRSAIKPKVHNDRAVDDEPSKKRKVEPEPKRSEVKKVQQPYRPFPTPSNNLNSSLASSIGRTGMAGPSNPLKSSQNGGSSLKASTSGSNNNPASMIGVKYLNPKMFQSSVGSTSASASLVAPRQQPRLPDPEPAIELPDIDSEYSDSGDEQHFEKVAAYPQWVQSPAGLLARQQYTNPDELFGPMPPLSMKDIFKTNTSKFSKRSSSAHWEGVDRLTESEMSKYSRVMGYTISNAAGGSSSAAPPN